MELDDILLKPASETEVEEAAKLFTSSRILNDSGYQLFLGNKFGINRNYYWLKTNPTGQLEFDFSAADSNRFVVDYANNLVHGLGSKAVTLDTFLNIYETLMEKCEEKHQFFDGIIKGIEEVNQLLEENLRMYKQGKINLDDGVLDHPNSEIKKDIEEARKIAYRLSTHSIFDPEFRELAAEFVKFYKKTILPKYGAPNQGSR